MQTDNTTAVKTAIDLACLFAKPLFNSAQDRLANLAIDMSLTVFSRVVLTDQIDSEIKIEALKSYLSNSNSLDNYQQDFYNFLAGDGFANLKTLINENVGDFPGLENKFYFIATEWAQSTLGWGIKLNQDLISTNGLARKQAFYKLLENPPADFYETFFYGKAVRAVEASNQIVETAQRMNQQLLEDIASQKFLSVAQVQNKIQERRNEVNIREDKRSIRLPPGAE